MTTDCERLEKSFLCARLRGLVHLDALVPVQLHVDDDVGLAEVVDEGRVDRFRRFVATRVEVDLLAINAQNLGELRLDAAEGVALLDVEEDRRVFSLDADVPA